ncbi:leucine-rich repeat domain-containing protein [Promethearchaeum syntrophicum]|uniref:Leucine-rich repeat domain-containing protein n=1 Tax=Promethearchaeum syntrophicum TaxID=2594042 RepID=A0A5B9DC61_9ARCH|nr:leucine-rich repeat domain-containing protein [Candidatus Prometheoarchaeum syntrophicum]QEE16276.1 Leucine Rich repeats (2 copies) [Candidatus Prometheoarchaeum syntrophicum]
MGFYDPREKLKGITDTEEHRLIKGLMDLISNVFGFNFNIENGHVVEIQMISTGLASIPRSLPKFPNLYKLQLQTNKIKKLRVLDQCENLQILNLSDNHLDSTGLALLPKLSALKSADFSYNKIDSMENFANLRELESLNLGYNEIKEIPALPNLSRLKFLDLTGNPIEKLENLQYLENLISIKLDVSRLLLKENEILKGGIDEIKEYCRNLLNN